MTAEDRAALAGELALGLLEGDERAGALRLVLADRNFAAQVEWWRDRFAGWFAEWPEVAPDAGLEARVMTALGGAALDGVGFGAGEGTLASRAVARWRAVAGAATLAAAGLLAALVLRPDPVAPPPPVAATVAPSPTPLLAVLTPTDDAAPLAAAVDRRTGTVTLAGTIELPADRVAELWTIGADGKPRSLGLLGGGRLRLAVAPGARARLAPTVTLAVSIEPAGGSRTGSPTGPVIATGPLTTI